MHLTSVTANCCSALVVTMNGEINHFIKDRMSSNVWVGTGSESDYAIWFDNQMKWVYGRLSTRRHCQAPWPFNFICDQSIVSVTMPVTSNCPSNVENWIQFQSGEWMAANVTLACSVLARPTSLTSPTFPLSIELSRIDSLLNIF